VFVHEILSPVRISSQMYPACILPSDFLTADFTVISHVKCVPCHHCMAYPQVSDGGDGLQIWTVATNVLSSSGQPKRDGHQFGEGWSGLTIFHCKILACYEMLPYFVTVCFNIIFRSTLSLVSLRCFL
jgi:hypothetical protein